MYEVTHEVINNSLYLTDGGARVDHHVAVRLSRGKVTYVTFCDFSFCFKYKLEQSFFDSKIWNMVYPRRTTDLSPGSLSLNNIKLSSKFGEGNGTPLQYSCLENPMDGGAW